MPDTSEIDNLKIKKFLAPFTKLLYKISSSA